MLLLAFQRVLALSECPRYALLAGLTRSLPGKAGKQGKIRTAFIRRLDGVPWYRTASQILCHRLEMGYFHPMPCNDHHGRFR